jgi:hypothetical protein
MYNKPYLNSTDLNDRIDDITNDGFEWTDIKPIDISDDDDAIYDEFEMLANAISSGQSYNSEWDNGVTLINEYEFTDHIRNEFIELGLVTNETLEWLVIDWNATANKQLSEYKEIELQGTTYYIQVN